MTPRIVLNVYSHWVINDDFERIAPSLVFLLLLTCRLVVDWQIVRSERSEKEKAAADGAAKPGSENAAARPSTEAMVDEDSADEAEVKKDQ